MITVTITLISRNQEQSEHRACTYDVDKALNKALCERFGRRCHYSETLAVRTASSRYADVEWTVPGTRKEKMRGRIRVDIAYEKPEMAADER